MGDAARLETARAVVDEARRWLGTPYRHQASCLGVGVDCLGLVRGVYEKLLPEQAAPPIPAYRPYGEIGEAELLWQAASTYLVVQPMPRLLDAEGYAAGDIVLFRMRPRLPARHLAILTDATHMLHAQSHVGVCEVAFTAWWRRHAVARFTMPPFGAASSRKTT